MSIKVKEPIWESMTLKSREVVVKADSAMTLKAGHPLFLQADGIYKAYAVDTDLSSDTITGNVVIIGEEIDIKDSDLTNGVKAYAIFMGNVYVMALREAGITNEKASDDFILNLSTNRSAINFIDYETKESWV